MDEKITGPIYEEVSHPQKQSAITISFNAAYGDTEEFKSGLTDQN